MIISIICPTYNEEKYIENILQHFFISDPEDKELYIIDGGSTDKTAEIVHAWTVKYPNIYFLHNPDKYVPFALNMAIPLCKGKYIVRIDAHTEFAKDYYVSILNTFNITGADIVGGPTRTRFKSIMQAAIAYVICTPFAIGNSRVHFEDFEGYTDSVTFGAWRNDIFKITGYFDTELVRNQDDEFHYRAKSRGFKIYQSPTIKLYYYPRSTLSGLFIQYYQYGLYKPLVFKKVFSGMKWRHLVPAFFVLYLLSCPLALWWPFWMWPLIMYLVMDIYFSLNSPQFWNVKVRSLIVFPVLHIAYGYGFLMGLWKWRNHK